jgi:hypothetical protein
VIRRAVLTVPDTYGELAKHVGQKYNPNAKLKVEVRGDEQTVEDLAVEFAAKAYVDRGAVSVEWIDG